MIMTMTPTDATWGKCETRERFEGSACRDKYFLGARRKTEADFDDFSIRPLIVQLPKPASVYEGIILPLLITQWWLCCTLERSHSQPKRTARSALAGRLWHRFGYPFVGGCRVCAVQSQILITQ